MNKRKFGRMALILALTVALSVGCSTSQESATPEHRHTFTDWETRKEATCTEAGEEFRRCTNCGAEETNPIPAKGHQWENETVVKQATCTENGEKRTDRCKICGAGGETVTIPAKGHQWESETVVKQATCTENGEKRTDRCKICGAGGETVTIPATGHQWGEETVKTPAGCTTAGLSAVKCRICGAEETKTISALGHAYGNVQTDAKGQFRLCSRCGARDEMGETVVYSIDVVAEEGCDFQITAENSIMIYSNSSIYKILEGQAHTEIELPRDNYLVRIDVSGDKYLSGQVSMTDAKPSVEIVVRNNPDFDPLIHPVKEGEKMFNFLVRDTRKEEAEYERFYDVAAGKKLIFLDFFYVACWPCEMLLEEHLKFYKTLSEDVKEQFLVIMVDTSNDSAEYINEYRRTHQIPDSFITMTKGSKVYANVPNERRVPHAVYLDKDFNLVRVGGSYDLASMIKEYIPSAENTSVRRIEALPMRKETL